MDHKRYAGSSLRLSPWEGAKFVMDMIEMLCGESDKNLRISSGARLVNEAKNLSKKSFSEPLTGEHLAQKIGVSREHLSKTFRQETGVQLRDYLSEQRLNEALSLLLKSNLSCKEIATICHYGSYSSFFRTFRKIYGISPDEFRKGKK
jgi:transcriptional regulator GlxA family with amidase domain